MDAKISENLKEFAAYGLIAGVIGIVGYILKAARNMNSVADKIGKSVDEISNSVHVDVSEVVAVEAVRRAAEKESVGIVARASKEAVEAVRNDIQKEVREAVGKAYASVKDDVRRELERKIDALNLDDVKDEIVESTGQKVVTKFGDALDSLRDIFQKRNNPVSENASVKEAIEAIYRQSERMAFATDQIAAAKSIYGILKSVENDDVKAFCINLLSKLADKCMYDTDKRVILALIAKLCM